MADARALAASPLCSLWSRWSVAWRSRPNAWLRGGTHLNIPGGYGYDLPGLAVGKSVTFGVPMGTSGGPNVVVKSAAADYPSNVTVRDAIIHTELGAPGRCTPVSGPDLGARWLVVTGALLRPGPCSVSHITVNSSSWWRDRTATSSMTASSNSVGP